jgi:hypothetical protein
MSMRRLGPDGTDAFTLPPTCGSIDHRSPILVNSCVWIGDLAAQAGNNSSLRGWLAYSCRRANAGGDLYPRRCQLTIGAHWLAILRIRTFLNIVPHDIVSAHDR